MLSVAILVAGLACQHGCLAIPVETLCSHQGLCNTGILDGSTRNHPQGHGHVGQQRGDPPQQEQIEPNMKTVHQDISLQKQPKVCYITIIKFCIIKPPTQTQTLGS